MRERSNIKEPVIDYAKQIGWDYLAPSEALRMRRGEEGLYLVEVLEAQLLRLNPGVLDNEGLGEVLHKLNLLKPTIEGNRDALEWMRGNRSVFIPDEKLERNVRLIDFDHLENNVFHITKEWCSRGSFFTNCFDVVFLINGIPATIAEIKRVDIQDNFAKDIEQLRRYQQTTPQMLIFPQVFVVSVPFLNLRYGITWNAKQQYIFDWNATSSETYEGMLKSFFRRDRFLRMLHNYILFSQQNDELTKVILRQHQIRTIEKVLRYVQEGTTRHALIWYTTGGGKALTMIGIASHLLQMSQGAKPTIIMIVDRNELESQLLKNIQDYGISDVRVAASREDLQENIVSDYRGLIISTVHKFEGIQICLNTRSDIIVLIDEIQRNMSGIRGLSLIEALPNAAYIGFSSTPIDPFKDSNRMLLQFFGLEGENGYLDKYTMKESIEEGTSVGLNYELAPHELLVEDEILEKDVFISTEIVEASDIEELNVLLDQSSKLKELLKSPMRIDKIAKFIATHFQENVNPLGFKAFLVAVDREACALYKMALDKYLPSSWSKAIYSSAQGDQEYLRTYALRNDEEKEVLRNFLRSDSLPKLLIVTQKLLTGFDAPILYCMYLDKPMRGHLLLHTISRINRPYQNQSGQVKPYGLLLDFVGIFNRLTQALALSDTTELIVQNVDTLKQLFAASMQGEVQDYLPWTREWDDKAKDRTVAHFEDKQRREAFYSFFRRLQNRYDVLFPSSFLIPYTEDYKALAKLFIFIREAYSTNSYQQDEEISNKTQDLLRKYTASNDLRLPKQIHELSSEGLTMLKQSDIGETTKFLNLLKALNTTITEEAQPQSFLQTIGEQVKVLVQEYEDHQITTQQALDQIEKLAQQYIDVKDELQKLSLDENTYDIYATLKLVTNAVTPEKAQAINTVLTHYPDYRWDEQQGKRARIELYSILHPILGTPKTIEVTNRLMKIENLSK